MNIIISADGELGFYLTKLLSEEHHDITFIHKDRNILNDINSRFDVLTVEGDSTVKQTLEMAKVDKADLVVAVEHEEQPNILTCIMAKKMGAKHCIARVTNPESLTNENKEYYNTLGINNIVSPELIASKEIINLLKNPTAEEVFHFSEGKLSILLLKLDEKAKVLNKSLRQINMENPDLQFRAIAIHRKGRTIIPKGDSKLLLNDLAYIIAKPDGIKQVKELGGKVHVDIKNVMVVGGGRIGKITCQKLEGEMHMKLIERDHERCESLTEYLDKTLIINGDSRDLTLLEEEGIANMDAFISVTNSTETNILTCLLAKSLGVPRTIALVENIDYINIAQNVNIDTIINKKLIAASYIENFTLSSNIISSKCLIGADAEAIELVVEDKSPATKKPIKDLRFPENAIIGGVISGAGATIATGDTQIMAGDKVVIFSLPEDLSDAMKVFTKRFI